MQDDDLQHVPDYVVLGHVAKDLLPDGGSTPGGTVLYSGLTAQRLGQQTAVVTACAEDDHKLLDQLRSAGAWVHIKTSEQTTTFTNRYNADGVRTQTMSAQAVPLDWDDVPPAWRRAAILHLGPIAQELPSRLPARVEANLVGITPQGWLRSWDEAGKVSHSAWPPPPALRHLPDNCLVVMSREDLGFNDALAAKYARLVPLLILTNGSHPASAFVDGAELQVPARRAAYVDPTGAGDVFAAALLVGYCGSGSIVKSVEFAHVAAALSIGARGTLGIPTEGFVLQIP